MGVECSYMTKDTPLPYLTRLNKKHRRVLAAWVREERRKGNRNCHEVDAVRIGIELLQAKMRDEKAK